MPYVAYISVRSASAPLPERGLIIISLVSSGGMPNGFNSGESSFVRARLNPLASKSSLIIKTAQIYGKIVKSRAIASLTPLIKAS